MSRTIVARRWAEALLMAVDASGGNAEAVHEELRQIAAALGSAEARVLHNPTLRVERRRRALDALLAAAGASPLVASTLRLALAKGRLSAAGAIAGALGDLLDARAGCVRGEGVSARPLPADMRTDIERRLGARIGATPVITWTEDSALLGGFRVRVGDRVWDASVATRLSRLGATIRKKG